MNKEGIIAGCDRNQEHLLDWWWKHYTAYNTYPVAFADFGMSETGLAWCRAKGSCFPVPRVDLKLKEIPKEKQELWEEHYGDGIWFCREIWFRKPLALLRSPFPLSIWIDLDCEVRGNLEPLFQYLHRGADLCLRKEKDAVQKTQLKKGFIEPGEINYNAGVIAFRQGADILLHWAEEIRSRNDQYVFDQHALARALRLHQTRFAALPPIYNWSMGNGANLDALIYHYHGGYLKQMIESTRTGCPLQK